MANKQEKDIDQLNSFLRGELSAVETYDQAIEKLKDEPGLAAPLSVCRKSHERRAELLRSEVVRLGGKPARGSGAWGNFARLVEGGAKAFGKKAAIAALEEGEDHGRDDYERDLDDLSPSTRGFIEAQLLPEQHRTHGELSALMKRV